jgi:SpoVK/Ycf46/Vps4 family AAA+-type ATPase
MDEDVEILDDSILEEDDDIEEITLPSLTYQVSNGRIVGNIDGLDAMRQAIDKLLRTERFIFEIYSDQYGNDLDELVGKEYEYVEADIARVLDEAIMGDDRVDSVEVTAIAQQSSNSLLANVSVTTMYGTITTEVEVEVS